MLEKYGTRKLATLIEPAIELAQNGFRLTERQGQTILEAKPRLSKYASSRKYFLKKGMVSYKAGDLLV